MWVMVFLLLYGPAEDAYDWSQTRREYIPALIGIHASEGLKSAIGIFLLPSVIEKLLV